MRARTAAQMRSSAAREAPTGDGKPGDAAGEPKVHAGDAADAAKWPRDLAAFVGLGVFFLGVLLCIIAYALRHLTEAQRARLSFPPTNLRQAQELGAVLSEYTNEHYTAVLLAHAAVYIYLQTFAIPGTVFANLLGGALFGMYIGFPLCLCYNTIGSVFLYWLSQLLGHRLVRHFCADRMEQFRSVINANRGQLTIYMTFMRIFPFTPNWFMNVASPQLRISLLQFAPAVFMGLTPYNFLSCKAGLLLSQLKSKSDIIDTSTSVQLALIAIIGFAAPLAWKRYQQRAAAGNASA